MPSQKTALEETIVNAASLEARVHDYFNTMMHQKSEWNGTRIILTITGIILILLVCVTRIFIRKRPK
ncbi:MAG: hypothetical protein LBC20_09180 [Planctomycetaceae bacterium]|nr:hypothetical protein [Planctomycetaceae bacterium]